MGFYKGHGDQNDDITEDAPDPNAKFGYVGGGAHGINNNYTSGPKGGEWSPDGGGEDVVNGWKKPGTSAFDKDVERSRLRGAQGQAAMQLDQGQADESRGMQMGSLGMMGDAARGNAPSRAAAIGTMNTDAGIRAGMAGMAGARGPGASVAAMRNASGQMGQQMGQQNQQVADMRAQEMARAQQGYASATQAARGQDIGAATTNAQLEAQQRLINEQHQQANERIGWDIRNTQMQGANEFANQQSGDELARRKQAAGQAAEDDANTRDNANMVIGAGSGVLSDERTKERVVPIGSLASLSRGRA